MEFCLKGQAHSHVFHITVAQVKVLITLACCRSDDFSVTSLLVWFTTVVPSLLSPRGDAMQWEKFGNMINEQVLI